MLKPIIYTMSRKTRDSTDVNIRNAHRHTDRQTHTHTHSPQRTCSQPHALPPSRDPWTSMLSPQLPLPRLVCLLPQTLHGSPPLPSPPLPPCIVFYPAKL